METINLVVARYVDGRVIKGTTRDFAPNRPVFHIERDGGGIVELRTRDLKALFFVKTLEGDPAREDVSGFVVGPAETKQGRKIAVRFQDGEFLCGYAVSWSPDREAFFLFPADAGNNNHRIWIICAAAREIQAGPQAELLAGRVIAEQKADPTPHAKPAAARVPPTPHMPVALTESRAPNLPSDILPRPTLPGPEPSKREHDAA